MAGERLRGSHKAFALRRGITTVSPGDQVCKGSRAFLFIILYDLAGHGRSMLRMVP